MPVAARNEERLVSLRLQRELLPARLADAESVSVAGHYRAASHHLHVGGDWYDSVTLPDGRLLLVVGDVVGHGLEAAAVMGRLRAGMAALASEHAEPEALLKAFDSYACGPLGTDFVTVCCAALDPRTGELSYASAGHPPPLVVEPDGATRWLTDGKSPPIGGRPATRRPQGATRLEAGSITVLYSDGLIERRGARLSDGLERVRRAAIALRHFSGDAFCERLVETATAATPTRDDIVVLAAAYSPAHDAPFRRDMAGDPHALPALRAEARRWLRARGVGERRCGEALIVLGEACANAIEHGYRGRDSAKAVEVSMDFDSSGSLCIGVRDFGRWRSPGGGRHRGHGTAIMQTLSAEFERTVSRDGTAVRVVVAVREAVTR